MGPTGTRQHRSVRNRSDQSTLTPVEHVRPRERRPATLRWTRPARSFRRESELDTIVPFVWIATAAGLPHRRGVQGQPGTSCIVFVRPPERPTVEGYENHCTSRCDDAGDAGRASARTTLSMLGLHPRRARASRLRFQTTTARPPARLVAETPTHLPGRASHGAFSMPSTRTTSNAADKSTPSALRHRCKNRQAYFPEQGPSRARPSHLSLDGRQSCAAGQLRGGSVAAFPIQKDGSLKEASAFVQHQGSSVNKQRRQGRTRIASPLRPTSFRYCGGPRPGPGAQLSFRRAPGSLTPEVPPL